MNNRTYIQPIPKSAFKKRPVLTYLALTYLITWTIDIPIILKRYGFYAGIRVPRILQTIATLSPGIVGLTLAIVYCRTEGLKSLFRSILQWRVGLKWYLLVFVLGIGSTGISLLLFDWVYKQSAFPDAPYNFFFYFILILPLSALWEEIGWRGFLLPAFRERYGPLQASVLIGFVWGLWHLPIYLALNPYGTQTILFFFVIFVGCFGLSVIQTWLMYSSGGSLLICILFHNTVNTGAVYFYGNIQGNQFTAFLFLSVLLIAIAGIILVKTKGNLNSYDR